MASPQSGDRYDSRGCPSAAEPSQTDAVAALVAVACREADPSRGDAAVAELAEVVRAAAGAELAAVWIHDPREAEGRLVAAAGVPDEAAAALGRGPLGARRRSRASRQIGPGGRRPARASARLAAAGPPTGG